MQIPIGSDQRDSLSICHVETIDSMPQAAGYDSV